LPIAIETRDLAAMWWASFSVSALSASAATTRLTRPISRARAAEIMSPVKSISIASLRATLRDSATIGVEQKSPILTPGVQKPAVSAAIARSQLATS
jgi:hypothetical protein